MLGIIDRLMHLYSMSTRPATFQAGKELQFCVKGLQKKQTDFRGSIHLYAFNFERQC